MLRHPKINRRGWIATWLQHRRRKRANGLLPAPVLRTQYPDLLVWDWSLSNPSKWNVWQSTNGGVSYFLVGDYWCYGGLRQFAPDGGSELYFIVGVDANGVEITERSNSVRPDDAILPAPVLTAVSPSVVWTWALSEPDTWRVFVNGESYDDIGGSSRSFTPEDAGSSVVIVGLDGDGNEITERSNAVVPLSVMAPDLVVHCQNSPDRIIWTGGFATSNPDFMIYWERWNSQDEDWEEVNGDGISYSAGQWLQGNFGADWRIHERDDQGRQITNYKTFNW